MASFPRNISLYLSLAEINLSDTELHTRLTNKQTKGRKGFA